MLIFKEEPGDLAEAVYFVRTRFIESLNLEVQR